MTYPTPRNNSWTALEQANVDALRARRRVRIRDDKATGEETATLRRWAGWGTMRRLFAPDNPESLLRTVQTLVTNEELDAGSRTAALNAHWTPPKVAADVWTAVTAFAATTGSEVRSVLEPSCGIGEFLAPAPQTVKMTGIEIDPVTADIARLLLPAAHVHTGSFASVNLPKAHFDLSVGNLPFGLEILTDQEYNSDRLPVAEHFLLKATRLVRPGGLLALIVPHRLLDSRDAKVRERVAELASLVTVVRFPSHRSCHSDRPGVVADLLILRRRPHGNTLTPREPAWTGVVTIPGSSIQVNEYFIHHQEHVLGDLVTSGNSIKVIADSDEPHTGLQRVLTGALSKGRGVA